MEKQTIQTNKKKNLLANKNKEKFTRSNTKQYEKLIKKMKKNT